MLKSWTKIFPVFLVEWYAKRNLQKFGRPFGVKNKMRYYVRPYKNMDIYID